MLLILFIPFLGTVLGSAMVYFLKGQMDPRLEKILLGFASGVMIAAAVWSLLIPAIDMSSDGDRASWFPAVAGFLLGMFFLLLIDELLPHLHAHGTEKEGLPSSLSRTAMLFFAVSLHNLPEGMAVGITYSGSRMDTGLSYTAALAIAIGIAIQNFPEGAIISLPMKNEGLSKNKAFIYGGLSGAVEPLGALLMIALAGKLTPFLPYFLSFAAGAMIYVVVEDLIPEAQHGRHSNLGTIGVALGFALMMVLDISLG